MNPIDKILEAFHKQFEHGKFVDRQADFIRTSFASYNKELREKVEGMKKVFPCTNPACGKESHPCDNKNYIQTLDQVLDLLK